MAGGAGFIGSHLCRALLGRGLIVHVVDNLITGRLENVLPFKRNRRFHFHHLDITSPQFLRRFFDQPFAAIYHLACPTGVPNIKRLGKEMLETCSIGTRQVLELARHHQAKVLFTSSCEVYGQAAVTPQAEDYAGYVASTGPRSAYEEGKRFAEAFITHYVRELGLTANIVRLFNVYGPNMSPQDQRVLPQCLNAIRQDRRLPVYGDGRQSRTFAYVTDVVDALQLVMSSGGNGEVYNIGDDHPISIEDLARLVISLSGVETDIEYLPHFTEDHQRRLPALQKIKALGWEPAVSLTEGLIKMMTAWGIQKTDRVYKPASALERQTVPVPVD